MAIKVWQARRYFDSRGWFSETFSARQAADFGIHDVFVQDNQSYSEKRGTIRGIHFQVAPFEQAKLVRCVKGRMLDIVVDLRQGSPSYGQSLSVELTARDGEQVFIPAGFGHAFVTLEDHCEVAYKVTQFYAPQAEAGLRWDCPKLAIDWGLDDTEPVVSSKDAALPGLAGFASPFDYDGRPMILERL